ncbi:MAG TPA: sulfur relay protein DsrC [Thiotrichales bacterium]|nr:sulfur relay protein DsrC [Thiotrichales bacterium]
MLWLSEILLQNHDVESFEELIPLIQEAAARGEIFFRMDVRPPFPDTPEDWEDRLEAAFSSVSNR